MTSTDNSETPDLAPVQWSRRSLLAAAWAVGFLVVGIVAVAFRGSWGALKDAALAIHYDLGGADTFPFGVDGVIVVAIAVMYLLRHVKKVRRYCLGVILVYTSASLFINVLHGFGMFGVDPATGERPMPPWPVVLLVASLAVSTIAVGSHLLVLFMLHLTPMLAGARKRPRPPKPPAEKTTKAKAEEPAADSTEPESDRFRAAVEHVKECRAKGETHPGERALNKKFELGSKRQGRNAITQALGEIEQERAAALNGSGGAP